MCIRDSERAVREMKGEAAPDEAETQLNLGLNIRIPADYVPEENQRLQMYKRVALSLIHI